MINFRRVYNIVVLYQRCDSTGPGPQWWPYWMSTGQMLDPLRYDHQIGCQNQGSFYYQPKQCTIKPPQHNHTYIHIFDLHNLIHPQKNCAICWFLQISINKNLLNQKSRPVFFYFLRHKTKPEVKPPSSFDKGTELFIPAILRKPSGNDKLKPQIFSSWDFEGPKK